MGLSGLLAGLVIHGLDAATIGTGRAGDRHCDYTRTGVEPWWKETTDESGERPAPSGLAAEAPPRG